MESDLEAATQEIEEAIVAQDKTKAELSALQETLKIQQARPILLNGQNQTDQLQNDYRAAEAKLNDERAALVAFDNELADLEKDLKSKKKEIVDAELALKKADHDIALAAKEKSALELTKENLEKQFTWILEESK